MLSSTEKIYVFDTLWPPANDHLSLSTEQRFVPIIAIDKIGSPLRRVSPPCQFALLFLNNQPAAQKLKRGRRTFELIMKV